MNTEEQRKLFEKWISGSPYEMPVRRWPEDDFDWPGEYVEAAVEMAWDAWQEALAMRGGKHELAG